MKYKEAEEKSRSRARSCNGFSTLETVESKYQDLTFDRLFTYFAGREITLRNETFKHDFGFLTKDGKYNMLAQLLSDDCHIPINIYIFLGKTKSSTTLFCQRIWKYLYTLSFRKNH